MNERLRVAPVQVDYEHPDSSSTAARVMRTFAILGIVYGGFDVFYLCAFLAGAVGIGPYSGAAGSWFALRSIAGGITSLLLVLSCMGCLRYKASARRGIIIYSVVAIAFSVFWSAAYAYNALDSIDYEPIAEQFLFFLGVVSGPFQSSVFPILVLIVFRMREVRLLFAKR